MALWTSLWIHGVFNNQKLQHLNKNKNLWNTTENKLITWRSKCLKSGEIQLHPRITLQTDNSISLYINNVCSIRIAEQVTKVEKIVNVGIW